MNPDQQSRAEIEAKLTALLLGELPAAEAQLLCWLISQDAGMKKMHDELQATIGLVRAVEKNPAAAPGENNLPLKLSAARRKKLLAHFQTPRPKKAAFWLKRIEIPSLIPALVAVAIMALLAAMLLPALSKAKSKAMRATASSAVRIKMMEARIEAENAAAAVPPATPALTIVPPEPKLAPPPAEIVLPKPDAPPETGFQNGTLADADSRNGGVYSQRIVGYNNVVLSPAPAAPQALAAPEKTTLPSGGAIETGNRFDYEENSHTVDTQKRMESVEKKWGFNQPVSPNAVPNEIAGAESAQTLDSFGNQGGGKNGNSQNKGAVAGVVNAFAGAGGFGGAGGGGAGGGSTFASRLNKTVNRASGSSGGVSTEPEFAGTVSNSGKMELGSEAHQTDTFQNGTTLAWDGSGGDRWQTENQPKNLGEEFRRSGAADTAGANFNFQAGNSSLAPIDKSHFGLAGDVLADRTLPARQTQMRATSAVTASDSWDFNGDVGVAQNRSGGGENFYRTSNGTSDADKVPVVGDLPVIDNLFASHGVSTPTATTAPASASTPGQFSFESFDGFVNSPVVLAETAKALPKSGSGALTLNGGNTYAGGTMVNGGTQPAANSAFGLRQAFVELATPSVSTKDSLAMNDVAQLAATNFSVDPGKFYTGLSKDDVAGLRYNISPATGLPIASPAPVQKAEAGKAEGEDAYQAAKRQLDQLTRQQSLLVAKIESEKLESEIPKTSMVQVTDLAEPAKSQTLWQKFTGEVESKVRIKVESDVNDIGGGTAPSTLASAYDPYFIQTTFENIQSDAVLGKVVDALKLDEAWAKNNGGEKLKKKEAIAQLKKRLDLHPVRNTKLVEIGAISDKPEEAAKIANAVAEAYRQSRLENRRQLTAAGVKALHQQYAEEEKKIRATQAEVDRLAKVAGNEQTDVAIRKPAANAPIPQPEILTRENAFSTFSLNVSDVSFKLAAASLEKGQLPDAAAIRSEEFINAFDYRDPEAAAGQPLAFAAERARYPFAHNRDLLRFSVKTAAAGRQAGRALNLVLLLDTSGSMERADRVAIIREALRVLAAQLQPQDTVSVVTFARTARLWADGVPGDKAGETLSQVGGITPEGGTNLEEAMRLAYETARRHYLAGGMNRVVLLTDGAANLGNVDPGALKQKVEAQRRQGIALDCFGIGWEDFNDDLLEQLSGNGDGRYAFINSPEDAANDFAAKLAGALQVAAQDVKVQVEFNPQRVISWRQIGYTKHQLTKEQFRDNSVIAAEIAVQEAGNALYTVETKPDGIGPIATVYVRYRIPGTQDVRERSWSVDYTGTAPALEQSSAAMRLAATASAFSEWLVASPFAQEVSPYELLKDLSGVPQIYGADQRPAKLETMIREAKSLSGK